MARHFFEILAIDQVDRSIDTHDKFRRRFDRNGSRLCENTQLLLTQTCNMLEQKLMVFKNGLTTDRTRLKFDWMISKDRLGKFEHLLPMLEYLDGYGYSFA